MIKSVDIAWVAGLLEGEGNFSYPRLQRTILIQCAMTDVDVLKKLCRVVGGNLNGPYKYGSNQKYFWRVTVTGSRAAGWMMTLYPLLGKRRRMQIRKALRIWKRSKLYLVDRKPICHPNRRHHGWYLCKTCFYLAYADLRRHVKRLKRETA